MNETAIFDKLCTILREHTAIKVEVTSETALLGQHVLDSMDFMNYLVAIETTYRITITDEDISGRQLGVIKNMVVFIAQKAG